MFDRAIWSYWQQGEERAPAIVRLCYESWRQLNPGWRVVVLDEHSLLESADLTAAVGTLERPDITVQKISDIDARTTPVYKLNWRVDAKSQYWTEVLPHLRRCVSS